MKTNGGKRMRNRLVLMMMILMLITSAGMLFAQAEPEQFPGITGQAEDDLSENEASGVLVTRVIADSAAERAGINTGDVIIAVDGHQVDTVAGIHDVLADYEHGQRIMVELEREGSRQTVELQLETRVSWPLVGITGVGTNRSYDQNRFSRPGYPGPESMHQWNDSRGMKPGFMNPYMYGSRLPEELIEAMESGDAARIVTVESGSPAEEGGLAAGAVILAVDGKPLSRGDLASAIAELNPGQSITLNVFDGDEISEITVKTGDNDGTAYLGVRYIPVGGGMSFAPQREPGSRFGGFGY
jgi:predicted metalloprotease with PDZ domain